MGREGGGREGGSEGGRERGRERGRVGERGREEREGRMSVRDRDKKAYYCKALPTHRIMQKIKHILYLSA